MSFRSTALTLGVSALAVFGSVRSASAQSEPVKEKITQNADAEVGATTNAVAAVTEQAAAVAEKPAEAAEQTPAVAEKPAEVTEQITVVVQQPAETVQSAPVVVEQPTPVVVTQPAPVVVTQPAPVVTVPSDPSYASPAPRFRNHRIKVPTPDGGYVIMNNGRVERRVDPRGRNY